MHELTKREADLVSGGSLIGVAEFDRIPFEPHTIKLPPIRDPVGGVSGRPVPIFGIGFAGGGFSSYGGSLGTRGTGDLAGGS